MHTIYDCKYINVMNAVTRAFNVSIYNSSNRVKFNKNSPYKGSPEDKEKILNILKDKFNCAVSKSSAAIGSKNLVYFSVFGVEFSLLLELLLKSLVKFAKPFDFDILIITDEVSRKAILAIDELKEFNYDFHIVKTPEDPVVASMYKLNIFDYRRINEYKNVLFLDADIICFKNINFLFNKTDNTLDVVDNLYEKYKREGSINTQVISAATLTHSVCYFLKEDKEYIEKEDPKVFNAGQFLFKNCQQMKMHFENIIWISKIWPSAYFYEQSFMNQYFVLNKLCSFETLAPVTKLSLKIISIKENTEDWEKIKHAENHAIMHFAGNSANAKQKYMFIKRYLNHFNICL